MRRELTAHGQSADLSEAIERVALKSSGSSPIPRAHRALFTVRRLTVTAACAMDCVQRHDVTLAEPLPYGLGEPVPYYAVSTRLLKQSGAQSVLTQLWTTEGGVWKVISWSFDDSAGGVDAPASQADRLRQEDRPSR
jgi:hypothetical protein